MIKGSDYMSISIREAGKRLNLSYTKTRRYIQLLEDEGIITVKHASEAGKASVIENRMMELILYFASLLKNGETESSALKIVKVKAEQSLVTGSLIAEQEKDLSVKEELIEELKAENRMLKKELETEKNTLIYERENLIKRIEFLEETGKEYNQLLQVALSELFNLKKALPKPDDEVKNEIKSINEKIDSLLPEKNLSLWEAFKRMIKRKK